LDEVVFSGIFATMFNRLKQKWGVGWLQFTLIFSTFALGGSLCGYLGRQVIALFPVVSSPLRVILYLLILTILWPACVLLVSIPLGQFSFFSRFLSNLGRRMVGRPTNGKNLMPTSIALFASGTGSNAQKLYEYFAAPDKGIQVTQLVCNKSTAGVISWANQVGLPVLLVEKEKFFSEKSYVAELQQAGIQFIVLAGFLWKIPDALIRTWPHKIVNIHPALLPKYGGKGMYGHFVHEAVLAAGDAESGITIHLVDEQYDHGQHLFQARCPVLPGDTPQTLARRVQELEHRYFGEVVEKAIKNSV
jgi:formyltetrahydrofolate-dependent phosphoribosylglycinamide formyltransferase